LKIVQRAERLRWYLARLHTMSAGEIAYRMAEVAKQTTWRNECGGWGHFSSVVDGNLIDLTGLRARLAHAWETPAKDALAESLRKTLAGAFELMGQRWPAPDMAAWRQGRLAAPFWLLDPVGRQAWAGSEIYCFSVDHRRTRKGRGDVKYVWELNRWQFLHPVAAEIARTGDAALTRWAFGVLASWADANPPFRGVNWATGIELATRMTSLALLVAAASPATLQPEERALTRRLIAAHGYWLYRYPSRYSSANNHLVLEGLGLLIAATLAPDLPKAANWARRARAVLEREAMAQIYEDGVGAEQSPTYQAFTLEAIAFGTLIARITGTPLASGTLDRLATGAEFLGRLLDDRGRTPAIGDDDEGRVIAQPPDREPRYVASVVAAVAGLAQRPELAPPDRAPHLRDALFDAPRSGPTRISGMQIFRTGGYTVVRDRIGGRRLHLVFDHGPLGYLSIAAHGHADALALWLTLDNHPVFVDAGTYLYHSGRATRDRLRESGAHNTLQIAGRSHSRVSGTFIWGSKADARLVASAPCPHWSVTGEHNGYVRPFGVTHVRRLAKHEQGFVVADRLSGGTPRPLPVELHFLCHPDLRVFPADGGVVVARADEFLVRIIPPTGFSPMIVAGEQGTSRGWYSRHFGDLTPAPMIVLAGTMAASEVVTRVVVVPPGARSTPAA
jgi:hypothetical protein